jgi:hypothetical protein
MRTLKEVDQECDVNLVSHLTKLVHVLEATLKSDIHKLKPSSPSSQGKVTLTLLSLENAMLNHIQSIDDEKDFKSYVKQNCLSMGTNALGSLSTANSKSNPKLNNMREVFGVELKTLVDREGRIVPSVIEKCTKAIEKHGLRSVGLYRLSGTQQHVASLKALFEKEDGVLPIEDREYLADINCITGVLKLFLKSLPTPLVSSPGYEEFVKVAGK